MRKGRELARFRKQLLAWFGQFQRDLPWRRDKDPYRIWLSEIMLQQTRVAAAIPYFDRFLQHFPTIQALADAPQEEVLRLWSGLGYYSRARNLQKAAQQIVARHGGQFPANEDEALALPGIGNYTAAAILSIAYHKKLAVLDGNVARVLARLGAIRGDLRESRRWQLLQQTANALLDPASPGDWNQAMMELGATLCTPRAPRCLLCPVSPFCQARKLGIVDALPEKRKKRAAIDVTLAAAVFLDPRGQTLLLPPPKSQPAAAKKQDIASLVSKMWHFPTTEVRKNAAKELRRFLAASAAPGKTFCAEMEPLPFARHAVTFRKILLQPFLARVAKLPIFAGAKIIALADVDSLPISSLTRKVAHAAEKSLASSTSHETFS
ncbi:MAG: A/G-specific adenine glycosylase [Candidatus Acidiferrum sp.]